MVEKKFYRGREYVNEKSHFRIKYFIIFLVLI